VFFTLKITDLFIKYLTYSHNSKCYVAAVKGCSELHFSVVMFLCYGPLVSFIPILNCVVHLHASQAGARGGGRGLCYGFFLT
jgi:hypothetical protein